MLRLLAVFAAALVIAGCGTDGADGPPPGPLYYDRTLPLKPQVGKVSKDGPVDVQRVTFDATDGERVPGLLALPGGEGARACVLYQGGIGSRKEDAGLVWRGLGALDIGTFTIDVRAQGERASSPDEFAGILNDPDALYDWLLGTELDLRRALDYLGSRPECDPLKIGYVGLSQGGILGTLLAGVDDRIAAAVIMSVGGDWDRALSTGGGLILPRQAADPQARKAALKRLEPLSLKTYVAKISPRPVLFLNGDKDTSIPLADARDLQAAAGQPKEVVVYDGPHNAFESPEALDAAVRFIRDKLDEAGT